MTVEELEDFADRATATSEQLNFGAEHLDHFNQGLHNFHGAFPNKERRLKLPSKGVTIPDRRCRTDHPSG